MKITREFCPGDRYVYDFGLCRYEKGWAQIDTAQDASFFGTWADPTRLLGTGLMGMGQRGLIRAMIRR